MSADSNIKTNFNDVNIVIFKLYFEVSDMPAGSYAYYKRSFCIFYSSHPKFLNVLKVFRPLTDKLSGENIDLFPVKPC